MHINKVNTHFTVDGSNKPGRAHHSNIGFYTYTTQNVNKEELAAVGTRKSDDIKQSDFLKTTVTSAEEKLNNVDLQAFINMANKLEIEGCGERQVATDSWEVALLYNGKVYQINYWHNKDSEEFMSLVNEIIELSLIPINLHGWV